MRPNIAIFFFSILLLLSACGQKTEKAHVAEDLPTANVEVSRTADEASLLATAKAAGVSDAEALAAKAEMDKVYDETSAQMGEAEAERNARMKQLRDDACVDDCSND